MKKLSFVIGVILYGLVSAMLIRMGYDWDKWEWWAIMVLALAIGLKSTLIG